MLQKINPTDFQIGGLDFRNKEDLLSHIAHYMDQHAEYELATNDFYREIDSYFRNRGLIPPRQLESFVYDNFVVRGILAEFDGKIFFRFRCFTEYFIAKQLAENSDFLNHVKSDDEILLSYFNEFDYLTGLQRKNKDLAEFIGERTKLLTDDYFAGTDIEFTPEGLESISFGAFPNLKKDQKDPVKKLRKTRLTEEERDDLLDDIQQSQRGADQKITRGRPTTSEAKAMGALLLLATVIKNCELIADRGFKKHYVNLCMELYLKFLYVSIIKMGKQLSDLDEETFRKQMNDLNIETTDESFEITRSKISGTVPLLIIIQFVEIIRLTLGTPKLETIFDEELLDQNNPVAKRMLYTLLYADLKLPAYIDKLEKIVKEVIRNDLYCEIIKQKLLYYYGFRKLTTKQKNQIENMIAGIEVRNKDHSNLHKSSVIANLRAQHKKPLASE